MFVYVVLLYMYYLLLFEPRDLSKTIDLDESVRMVLTRASNSSSLSSYDRVSEMLILFWFGVWYIIYIYKYISFFSLFCFIFDVFVFVGLHRANPSNRVNQINRAN